MRIIRVLTSLITAGIRTSHRKYLPNRYFSGHLKPPLLLPLSTNFVRQLHDENDFEQDFEDELELRDSDVAFYPQVPTRNVLYEDSTDGLILKFKNCVSVQEVLDLINENETVLDHRHVAQAVLVLWDIQKIFYTLNSVSSVENSEKLNYNLDNFVTKLNDHTQFQKLLNLIEVKCKEFDPEALSCIMLYLDRMACNEGVVRLLTNQFYEFRNNLSLTAISRYFVTIFSEPTLASIFMAQDFLPFVIEKLEKCETADDLKLVTICFNQASKLITEELFDKYCDKTEELIAKDVINFNEYRTVLKIIFFLNHPQWRNGTTNLIAKCILLLKNHLNLLNPSELISLQEIFYKHQEPAEILNEIQRCASKLMVQLDEEPNVNHELRFKLLCCLITFSSPMQRPYFEKLINKYINEPLSFPSLLALYKILLFTKTSDHNLCKLFWTKLLDSLKKEQLFKSSHILFLVGHKYMTFHSEMHYYNREFENQMLEWLDNETKNSNLYLFPVKLSLLAPFIFIYGNETKIDEVVQKIEENWEQFNHHDCLKIAKALRFMTETSKNSNFTRENAIKINYILNKSIKDQLKNGGLQTTDIILSLKNCIYRKQYDEAQIETLLFRYDQNPELSSKVLRNVVYCLGSINSLLPNTIEQMVDYMVANKDNILGFNAQEVVFLCYSLGYVPKNAEKFFEAVIGIIIRDQERLSGLSYLQTALALCFFNRLPPSFIKKIFNVEFLEKLDRELTTCYYKDKYPLRVRHNMMQLNRAVCLDYPQHSVPWFHQKYIEELQKNHKTKQSYQFPYKVKEALLYIFRNEGVEEDVFSPYGYHIDFCINEKSGKIAVLLMRPHAYTKVQIQLKGHYQLKKRHLEMLGYRIVEVDFNRWKNLSPDEEIGYLTNLLWPIECNYVVIKRQNTILP